MGRVVTEKKWGYYDGESGNREKNGDTMMGRVVTEGKNGDTMMGRVVTEKKMGLL